MRDAYKLQSKFWLMQPLRDGVRYYVKHSGEWLYKISNEEDLQNFKVTKIRLPAELNDQV